MVQEHVGKKRRKEVRQAISMRDEMKKTLLFSIVVLVVAIVIIFILYFLMFSNVIDSSETAVMFAPVAVAVIALVLSTPKASKYWAMREKYKDHLARYNITKDDMRALESQDV